LLVQSDKQHRTEPVNIQKLQPGMQPATAMKKPLGFAVRNFYLLNRGSYLLQNLAIK